MLCVYFSYHAIYGSRSIVWLRVLDERVAQAEEVLETVQAQRMAMERDVVMLRPASLDRDFLQEMVMQKVAYSPDGAYVLVP